MPHRVSLLAEFLVIRNNFTVQYSFMLSDRTRDTRKKSWLCDLKWNSHQRSDKSNVRGSVKNASQLSLNVKRKIECPEFNHLFVTGFVPLRSKLKPQYLTATNPGILGSRPQCKCSTTISLNLSVVSLRPWPSRLVVASTSAARCRNLLRTCFLSGPGTAWP